jgi:hypothetical protein
MIARPGHACAAARSARIMRPLLIALLLPALAACKDEAVQAKRADAIAESRIAGAAAVTEAPLRARLRLAEGELRQRGVQVFRQALPDTYAVCGRATRTGTGGEAFLPYVAVVTFAGRAPRVQDLAVALTSAEAGRVYLELTDRCFDGGGPASLRAVAHSMPPLPTAQTLEAMATAARDDILRPAVAEGAADSGGPATIQPVSGGGGPLSIAASNTGSPGRAALRQVTTTSRHGANIRNEPRGAEVLRVAPRATTLDVYGEAPGGWVQVGLEGEAWGWVHASVLEGAAR